MNYLFGCDQELIYEIRKMEELDSLQRGLYNNNFDNRNNNSINSNNSINGNNINNMSAVSSSYVSGGERFADVPLMQWTPQNCIEWVLHICQIYKIDKLHIDISVFNKINGQQLMQSTERHFYSMFGDQYGSLFFNEFKKLKKNIFDEIQSRYSDSESIIRIDQSHYTASIDPYIPNMDTYSTTYTEYKPNGHLQFSNTESPVDLGLFCPQYLQDSNHNTPEFKLNENMENSNTESQFFLEPYPQYLQDSNHKTSEFEFNGNMECSNSESQVTLGPYPLYLQDSNHNTSEFKLKGNL
ncbi:unnamed protein product, partial [Meganyctiphanes norvegica]